MSVSETRPGSASAPPGTPAPGEADEPETKPLMLQRPATGPAMPPQLHPGMTTQVTTAVHPPVQPSNPPAPPKPTVSTPSMGIQPVGALPQQPHTPKPPSLGTPHAFVPPGTATPAMGNPPYQSQVVAPHQSQPILVAHQSQPVPPQFQQQPMHQQPPPYAPPPPPAHPSQPALPQAVPPAAGSSPRMGNTGTIPALPAAVVTGPQPQVPPAPGTGGFARHAGPPPGPPRITVQYPQIGSTLKSARGTYVVQSTIGSGEFGAVYECIGPFDQTYALKMVRPSNRPYSEVQAEWAREQSRLFSLRHPNVVYIYDSFEQGHLFYLALERCDHALKAMLGTPMQEGLVLEMTRQLLAAVQFLHDNDVVHDDLHAGNVLITHTDRPTVKISDFGISNELRGMTAVRPNVVHHAIMAPEILATGYTSRQSDIYQVGLLLYWMLTGEPAIQMDVPYQELVRQVAEGEPRQRADQIGTPFGTLIAKMLRRREAFRYTSAREVWADLRELPAWKQRALFPTK